MCRTLLRHRRRGERRYRCRERAACIATTREYREQYLRNVRHDRFNDVTKHTIDITEATSFALLRVMQTSCPVDRDIALAAIESRCALHTATRANPAEFKQAVKDRTIVTNVAFPLLFLVEIHVIWRDFAEEVDVFVGVELGHFEFGGGFCALRMSI